jgi:large subunit ribosomal protein L22
MKYSYAIEKIEENAAKACGKDLGISTKMAIEICNSLRYKKLDRAKSILKDAIDKKKAIPFKRFHRDLGHKPGMAAGRYPVNACKEILRLLESTEANAVFKGLSAASLKVTHVCAKKASEPWHYGRHKRRKMKRTHVEIVLTEFKNKEEKKE